MKTIQTIKFIHSEYKLYKYTIVLIYTKIMSATAKDFGYSLLAHLSPNTWCDITGLNEHLSSPMSANCRTANNIEVRTVVNISILLYSWRRYNTYLVWIQWLHCC